VKCMHRVGLTLAARAARLARGGVRPGGPCGHGGSGGGGGGRPPAPAPVAPAAAPAAVLPGLGTPLAVASAGWPLAPGLGRRSAAADSPLRPMPQLRTPAAGAQGPGPRSVTKACAGLGCSSLSRPPVTGVRSRGCARPSAALLRRRPLSHRSAPAAHPVCTGTRRNHPGACVHAGAQPSRSRLSIGGGPEAVPPPLLSYRATAPAVAAPPPAWAPPGPENADPGAAWEPGAPAPPLERPGSAAASAVSAAPGPPPRLSALALPHTQRLLSPGALPRPRPGPTQARRAPPWRWCSQAAPGLYTQACCACSARRAAF